MKSLLLALALAGCAKSAPPSSEPPATPAPSKTPAIPLREFDDRDVIGYSAARREVVIRYSSTEEEMFEGVVTWVLGEEASKRTEVAGDKWAVALQHYAPVTGVAFTGKVATPTGDLLGPCTVTFDTEKIHATCGAKTASAPRSIDSEFTAQPTRAYVIPGTKHIVVTYEYASDIAGSDRFAQISLE